MGNVLEGILAIDLSRAQIWDSSTNPFLLNLFWPVGQRVNFEGDQCLASGGSLKEDSPSDSAFTALALCEPRRKEAFAAFFAFLFLGFFARGFRSLTCEGLVGGQVLSFVEGGNYQCFLRTRFCGRDQDQKLL